ncbi:small integral membrane protein 15-like [Arapaima gigas]
MTQHRGGDFRALSERSPVQLSFFRTGFGSADAERSMIDVKAWAQYVVEWAAKDPYGFLTTVILALTPLFIASALLSWKLAKMIEARDREQKKKQKRQENIAKAKKPKKD